MTRTTVARTREEVEALRPVWERLAFANPEADPDFFLELAALRDEIVEPYVVLIERDGRGPIMIVARVEERRLETKAGYRTVHRPKLRQLAVVYSGVHGAETEEDCELVVATLRRALRDSKADVVSFAKLGTESPLFKLASAAPPPALRDHLPTALPRASVAVPDSYDEFLKARSRNTRENVKRYGKKLLREHGEQLELTRYRDVADLDRAVAEMDLVAAKTYQRGLGVGFRDDHEGRALMRLAMERGWYRAWVLSIAGAPVAFWYGLAYAGTFFIGTPGYDPEYGELRVGLYLQMRMMEDLCADPTVHAVDYGFGDAQYKRSFGDTAWEEADVLLFAPTFRAARINAIRTSVVLGTRLAKRALGPERVGQLKRRARRQRAAAAA